MPPVAAPSESRLARPFLLNFRQDGLRYTEGGFPQASDHFIEFDQSGLIGIVKDREGTSDFEASVRGFLSTCQFVDQHHACSQFDGERDRLAFSEVELCKRDGVFRAHDFEPDGMTFGPLADRTGSCRMCQFIEYSGWNENTSVQLWQDRDLVNENQVVDWRGIRYDDHEESRLRAEPLSSGAGGEFPDPVRNPQPC